MHAGNLADLTAQAVCAYACIPVWVLWCLTPNLTLSNYAQCCPFPEVSTVELWNHDFTVPEYYHTKILIRIIGRKKSPSIFIMVLL